MKYLGIDYGTKRVGLAVSDDEGRLAFPLLVLENRGIQNLADDIARVCRAEKIDGVVLGNSLTYALEDNPIMDHVRRLEQFLKERIDLPIYYENEILSSREAEHIQGKNDMHDASAAAIILGSFLDRRLSNDS